MAATPGLNYNSNQWSVSRNGLVTIQYISNVRDLNSDITRSQTNDITKKYFKTRPLIEDHGEAYTVFNSEKEYDINDTIPPNELYELLTIPYIKQILNTFSVPFNNRALKSQLVQLLSSSVQQQPMRLKYVREVYANQRAQQRLQNQQNRRDPNTSLLVSNHHRYAKSDFEGMNFNEILESLFDINAHRIFLYEKVLKSVKMPTEGPNEAVKLLNELNKKASLNPNLTQTTYRNIGDVIFKAASEKSDKILQDNTEIVLSLLFAPKRPFYINKKLYTVLGFHTEGPKAELIMNVRTSFVINPQKIYLELSEKAPTDLTENEIRNVACHLQTEKIRKDWYDLWNSPPTQTGQAIRGALGMEPARPPDPDVFERKHHQTLKRKIIRGGKAELKRVQGSTKSKNKKKNKTRKSLINKSINK